MMEGYFAFNDFLRDKGAMVSGEALKGVEIITCVRIRGDKIETMDRPFAETKEHLGGFYVMDVPDLDTALRYAAMIPGARHGTIEVRPHCTRAEAAVDEADAMKLEMIADERLRLIFTCCRRRWTPKARSR